MNSKKHKPRWPFLLFLTGLFLLGVILPKIWDLHDPGQAPDEQAAEISQSAAPQHVEFPDAAVEFPLDALAAESPTFDSGPVLVLPSEKILTQAPGGQVKENDDTPQITRDKNLVPQKEVVADVPAPAENKNDIPSPPVRDGTSASGIVGSGTTANFPGGQTWLASRPKRLETLPESLLPDGKTSLIEPPATLLPPSAESSNPFPANPSSAPSILGDLPSVSVVPSRAKKGWSDPETLRKSLKELAADPATASWAKGVLKDIDSLGPAMENSDPAAARTLDRLSQSAASATQVAQGLRNRNLARQMHQAGYALQRRLDVWQSIYRLGAKSLAETDCPSPDPGKLALCLTELDSITKSSSEGDQWRDYLLIETLKVLMESREKSRTSPPDQGVPPYPVDYLPSLETADGNSRSNLDQTKREVAQKLLARLMATPTTGPQRQFLDSPSVLEFREQVSRLAAEPISPADVLSDMERYERTRLGSDARRLAFAAQVLALSDNPDRQAIAQQLERNYRNANLRVALNEEFLNRLAPESKTEYAPVQETVLGIPVRGRSMTSSDVRIKLVPDPHRARLALEIIGEVAAMTSSTSGPATFVNDSESLIFGSKQMEIDPKKGVRLFGSNVNVQSSTRLRGLRTDYDRIPIFNRIVRGIAQNQHELSREDAETETRQKMEIKARQRLDAEARQRMSEMVDRLNQQVFGPLDQLALDPTIVDAQTTEDRLTMRLRAAGGDQLGSHTPRPQAPTDCLASFQLNESLLNNALARLQLDGKTMTLKELSERIGERFQRPDVWKVPTANEDVEVSFAAKDPVRIRCTDGHVILEMAIAEFSKPPRTWRNFRVRVFYRPQINGRKVELARDGPNHLLTEGLSLGSRLALSGAFEKAFPSDQPVNVTPERLLNDPKLADLQFTQMLIDDGWVGMALGTKEQAARTARRK